MMTKTKKIFLAIVAFVVSIPAHLFAAVGNMQVDLSDANPIAKDDIFELINAVLDFVVKIGAAIVVLFLVYSGFLFITAQGNEDKLSKAKTAFFWTVVGALILLGAATLSQIVCNTAKDLGANVSCTLPLSR